MIFSLFRPGSGIGITMIWVEHDMRMVAGLADTIHVPDHGEHVNPRPAGGRLVRIHAWWRFIWVARRRRFPPPSAMGADHRAEDGD